jgi:uncharacterized protein YlaI
MSTTSVTMCDSCDKIIEYIDLNVVEINGKSLVYKPYYYFDLCPECLQKMIKKFGVEDRGE